LRKEFLCKERKRTQILGSLDLAKQPKNNLNSDIPGHLKERRNKGF
jgi:hypothetical protein